MTEREKKAIKKLETIKVCGYKDYIYNFEAGAILNIIQEQQEELEKKDKIINEIVKSFKQDDIRNVEEIKQYFLEKVGDR